jgi:hypothetical protein
MQEPSKPRRKWYYVLGGSMLLLIGLWFTDAVQVPLAKAWCEEVQGLIEAHRTTHGKFPTDLKALDLDLPSAPALIPDNVEYSYHYQGKTYSLDFGTDSGGKHGDGSIYTLRGDDEWTKTGYIGPG